MNRRAWYPMALILVVGWSGAAWGQQKATNPNPADGAVNVVVPLLRWTPGSTALLHDVYLGTTPDLGPANLVAPRQPVAMLWYVPGIVPGTTYYWRVDEIDKDGVTVHTGDVWTFLAQPKTAYKPDPADGANTVSPTTTLEWLQGSVPTVKYHVYLSDNREAVGQSKAEADKGTVTDPLFTPAATLEAATTYYWRVDTTGADGSVLAGPLWSFTTMVPIDDFESYTDAEGSRIYEIWIDGWTNNNGSTVGYATAPFAEQRPKFVHGGAQSMPLDYNNINAPWYSEAEFALGSQDWTVNGADTLVLHVRGRPVDIEVPRVSTPPTIDAKIDPAWSQASIQYIKTKVDGADPTSPADASGQFRVLYDADNLYVLVEVNDDVLVQDSDPAQGWLDDRIEVFIDGDNSKNPTQDTKNDYQYCFRWNHGMVETPVEWYRSPGSLAGVKYAVVTTATGYLAEIKLPWVTMIGGPAKPGQFIGIDVMIDDDDDGGDRDTQMAWYLTGGDPHRPNMWGTAVLAETSKPADRLYVAIEDAAKHKAIVVHPNPDITKLLTWDSWKIPLSDFAGMNLAAVKKMYIGVGDRNKPAPGGAGIVFIDDIYLTRPAAAK